MGRFSIESEVLNRRDVHLADSGHLQPDAVRRVQLRGVVDYLRSAANRRRIAPLQRAEADYALLNDCAHNYSVLHYYIRRDVQARQLAGAGFELIECLDGSGRALRANDDDSAWPSLYYIARPTA